MSVHRNSTFKNTCIKTPVNPKNNHPIPLFERTISNNQIEKELQYNCGKNHNSFSNDSIQNKAEDINLEKSTVMEKNVFSLVDFFDSIPGKKKEKKNLLAIYGI